MVNDTGREKAKKAIDHNIVEKGLEGCLGEVSMRLEN